MYSSGVENIYVVGAVQVGAGALTGGVVAEATGGKFYEGALMGTLSGVVAFGTVELVDVYLPQIRQLEARAIEMLGEKVRTLKKDSLGRPFKDSIEFGKMTEEERDQVRALYESSKGRFSPNIQILRSIDAGHNPGRFGPLHVRFDNLTVHFDNYDIVTHPFNHAREYFYQK